ncbi:MAG: hypothetical protein D9N11_16140 [Ketobacter sp.]|nr:MAG: hypothetical protein D9N11_16140 [Ketobacter sp.]
MYNDKGNAKRLGMLSLLLSFVFLSGCEYNYTGDGYSILEENPNAEPWFNVYRPADMLSVVEDTGRLLPVVVWANGGCLRSDFTWQPLFKRWAAAGYVVLALAESPEGPGALGMTDSADHGQLIDWALTQSSYTDLLDSSRIVAAGNSCGGVTAMELAAEDARVSAIFVLSGSSAVGSSSIKVMENITVPLGFVVGGSTDIAGRNAIKDYEILADGIPAMIVSRFKGGHLTVSTNVPILEQEANIALNWMNLALYGSQAAYDELTSDVVCSNCVANEWTVNAKSLELLLP